MYVTPILEISDDPLSDTTPTWTDITQYLLSARWWGGIDKDGDDPQPGGASFVLDDRTRIFEPDAAGTHAYPMRRFRLRVQNGVGSGTTYDEGIYYAVSWEPSWDGMMQETTVTCVDGFGVLSRDLVDVMDPPEAESFEDVVAFDEVWAHYRQGDPPGTRMVASVRKAKKKGNKRRRRKPARTFHSVLISELGAVSGPAGRYTGKPMLGRPGLIVGDSDTCVRYTGDASATQAGVVVTDANSFSDRNSFTVGAKVLPITLDGSEDTNIVFGPMNATWGAIFALYAGAASGNAIILEAVNTTGTLFTATSAHSLIAGIETHVYGRLLDGVLTIFLDGVADGEAVFAGTLAAGNDTQAVTIGGCFAPVVVEIDEVVIAEPGLSDERILAHYDAGANRGWAAQTAGERIAAIATNALWSTAGIQTGGRMVQPEFMHGQDRIELIAETAHAEGVRPLFFFDGTGNPIYLSWGWQDSSTSYSTPQATFGNQAGEVPYDNIEFVYDDEVYETVRAGRAGGVLVGASDTALEAQIGPSQTPDYTDLILNDEADAQIIADDVLDFFHTPGFRPARLFLDGDDSTARGHIFTRLIGHNVRIKHRPRGGTAIDRVTHILGYEKVLTHNGLTCTWNLARGFNAADTDNELGMVGFSELTTTLVLA